MRSAIVFVTDKNGLNLAEHAAAAALLTQETKNFIIFCTDFEACIDPQITYSAKSLEKKIEYRQLTVPFDIVENYVQKGAQSHVSSTALLKMNAIWSLQGEFDRVLYIDNDVLLMKDFNLQNIDFEGLAIAAVYDIAIVGDMGKVSNFYRRCAAMSLSAHYFNSGVIAVDLTEITAEHLKKYRDALAKHVENCDFQENCSCNDQCAWNLAFRSGWKRLPLSYNFQACALFNAGWNDAIARHYVGRQKFLPVKRWRNDRRDTKLIAQARRLLALPSTKIFTVDIARRMNAIRNWKMQRDVDMAINKVRKMYDEALQGK